ncbi:MAG: hypothetical protein KZQ83_19085 [gamma proteobacterium symbiont of Taylorina sp.]|nr:hypothetical protein [gamma proteobacterium symbiont of Taylorina sp.]
MKTFKLFHIFLFCFFILFSTQAFTADGEIDAKTQSPLISGIQSEFATDGKVTLTISGINFLNNKGEIFISVGHGLDYVFVNEGDMDNPTDGKIILTADLAKGDYLIMVSTDRNFNEGSTAKFDLTIGGKRDVGDNGLSLKSECDVSEITLWSGDGEYSCKQLEEGPVEEYTQCATAPWYGSKKYAYGVTRLEISGSCS